MKDGNITGKGIVFYLMKKIMAIKTPTIPMTRLIFGKSNLSRNPAFLFNSPTSESIGSQLSDIMVLLSLGTVYGEAGNLKLTDLQEGLIR
jgi:hypothetical protein